MQTRLTDPCPGSHFSTSFATKAATNATPCNGRPVGPPRPQGDGLTYSLPLTVGHLGLDRIYVARIPAAPFARGERFHLPL